MSQASDAPAGSDFESWDYDKLRDAAIDRARHRLDLGFFIDLMAHTPALTATADEGGSLGEIGGSIIEVAEATRQAFGKEGVGELEPMFRAVFADYLKTHPKH